ncbi:hypothetical protein NX801_26410 [Streptomyces sp. LP05-1]|uniref:Uncharacterized protein n=1 Tax=Streptomyces pyxinae TaxID=2970734 RepID=A0ABT2CNV0_9ACTN|nr:hypothetical protein [Streptomyces sp. LP05-1]MCS0639113.1 hypothetical protein [Streptomyces sp. LP05-1]
MDDTGQSAWTTYVRGERTELPSTINAIRAALPAGRRAAFDAEIGEIPAEDLSLTLMRWALSTTEAVAEDAEVVTRLRRGEQVGRPHRPR